MKAEELLEKYAKGERDFKQEHILGTDFSNAQLSEVNLSRASWHFNSTNARNPYEHLKRPPNFSEANLENAQFVQTDLAGSNLTKANLAGANFTKASLKDANLEKANLEEADLKLTNISNSNFSEANLTNAYLVGAELFNANLRKACLEGASLEAANLYNADLMGANLNRANLRKADLRYANLYGTTFDNADLTDAIMPDGEIYNLETSTNKQPKRTKSMERQIIKTDSAPAPVGPYNQAIAAQGKMLFVSGQIAIDTRLNEIVYTDNVAKQTEQVMNNLEAILTAAGATWSNVVKTTVFLKDMNDFATVNGIYAKYFDADTAPARACVEVSRLPKDVLVEIDCIAVV